MDTTPRSPSAGDNPGQPYAAPDVALGRAAHDGKSEYEQLEAAVRSAYQLADVNLEKGDLNSLAADAGVPPERIDKYVRAALAASANVQATTNDTPSQQPLTSVTTGSIPAAAFYGWYRQGFPTNPEELFARPADSLRDALKAAIGAGIVPATLGDQLDSIVTAVNGIRADMLLSPAASGASVSLGDAIRTLDNNNETLTADQARKFALLLGNGGSDDDVWNEAARIGLSSQQITGLQRVFLLNTIVGGDPAILREANTRLQQNQDAPATSLVHRVAAMEPEDWLNVLEAAHPADANDASLPRVARELTLRAADFAPTQFLLVRAHPPEADSIEANLREVAHLEQLNGRDFFGKPFAELNTKGIPARERNAVKAAHDNLRKLVNYYPGLGLGEILASDAPPAEKVDAVTNRVSLVEKLFTLNPEVDFLSLDYLPDSPDVKAVKFDGFHETEKELVLRTMKAYERVTRVTGNALRTKEALEAGFDSGTSIANVSLDTFVQATGMSRDEAEPITEAATNTAIDAGLTFMAIDDFLRPIGYGKGFPISNPTNSTGVRDYLRRLDGFDAMFGRQSTCACTHCQSVLSPGAYFVDLMRFIDQNVTDKVFAGPFANHPLKLQSRRPDLWKLELTCDNTNNLVPYLDIINEVLEDGVIEALAVNPVPNARADIQKIVYAKLADTTESFQQPLVLPLRRIEAYLQHFQRTRADIARALGVTTRIYSRARLGFSLTEWGLVAVPRDNDQPFLTRIYGADITTALTPAKEIDSQRFLKLASWSREDLGKLFNTQFVSGGANVTIRAKKSSVDSVQNDIEVVSGLTYGILDRLHRFTRLWRKLPWTIPELDLVLVALKTGASVSLDPTRLDQIASLLDIQARLGIPVDQLLALFTPIPTTAPPNGRSLFDRLFNLEPFVSQDGAWPKNQQFTHPSEGGGTSQPDNKALQRLLAGLQISDTELVQLIAGLSLAQPFALDLDNLSALYRHARLARLLRLSMPEFFQLMALSNVGSVVQGRVSNWTDLTALVDAFDKWNTSARKLDDLGYVTGGVVLKPATFPDPAAVAAALVSSLRDDRVLEFADTVFSQVPGITEAQSRQIIAANQTAFEGVPNTPALRLKNSFDPDTGVLTVPAGIALELQKARALLDKFHPRGVVPGPLASALGTSENKLRALSTLAGDVLTVHDPNLVAELQRTGPATSMEAIVRTLSPLTVLFNSDAWDSVSLTFVHDNPAIFSLISPIASGHVGLESAFKTAAYGRLTTVTDNQFTPEKPQPDAESVRRVLKDGFGDNSVIAKALRVPITQIAALVTHVTFDASKPFEALERLESSLAISDYLGVSGETLQLIVPAATTTVDEYTALSQAAEALYGVIRTKYPDEKTFAEKVEPYEDKIRGLKRTGLVEYLLRSTTQGFATPNDLFDFFLVDTQLEGCARTSRVVAANSSLQLYVHRVLMNLEQSSDDDPNPVAVSPGLIPSEWSWRSHYRVWEANRKVFLYPESYIEPELRDDKTPLFLDLESTLLQQPINEDNVSDAYLKYLAGFDEVNSLRIAGAFHDFDNVNKTDLLHLFGATLDEPPQYFYRTVRNTHYSELRNDRRLSYSPWRKVNVQIPVRKVTAAVFRGKLFVFWWSKTTSPVTSLTAGSSTFSGYKHKLTLSYSSIRADGSFTAPQAITCDPANLPFDEPNVVLDPILSTANVNKLPKYRPVDDPGTPQNEPRDSYSLSGLWWDRPIVSVYPDGSYKPSLTLEIANNSNKIAANLDLVARRSSVFKGSSNWSGFSRCFHTPSASEVASAAMTWPGNPYFLIPFPMSTTLASRRAISEYSRDEATGILNPTFENTVVNWLKPVSIAQLASPGSIEVLPINGKPENAILQTDFDLFLLVGSGKQTPASAIRRLGTRLTPDLHATVSTGGFGAVLDTTFQESLKEVDSLTTTRSDVVARFDGTSVDFSGPFGNYLREVLFHIPFLIANSLNSQQRFSAAQRWYHYIFNPTSSENGPDRVWRYREFRGLTPESLRHMLTDDPALEAYRLDPFNPHAIARLRLSAYEKSIVMKYIDNLLDWGDTLFAEFTLESVNEATMLYIMAADILGPRPAQVGECGEGDIKPKTYETISKLGGASDFLIEMEHFTRSKVVSTKKAFTFTAQSRVETRAYAMAAAGAEAGEEQGLFEPAFLGQNGSSSWRTTDGIDLNKVSSYGRGPQAPVTASLGSKPIDRSGPRISVQPDPLNPPDPDVPGLNGGGFRPGWLTPFDYKQRDKRNEARIASGGGSRPDKYGGKLPPIQFGVDVAWKTPVFCVPPNADFLAYWDRVDDRLYKIRHCQDITGATRQLSLFAPEIDPRLLVRAKAAGLSLEDVLNVTSGNIPPYRFTYLIEKAKQYAATVQSFGNSLLSAFEKKDAEELSRLRTVHEQNTLKLRTRVQEWEIEAAQDTLASLEKQHDAIDYRRSHYEGLIQTGLTNWERKQQDAKRLATGLHELEASFGLMAGILRLLGQFGAPTAMKYGGVEVGGSMAGFALAMQSFANLCELDSAASGVEAVNDRRQEEWAHQEQSAAKDLASIDQQIEAAKIRIEIMQRSLESHNKTVEQAEEIFEFYRDKFTSIDLFTLLSSQMNRIYREAFNATFAVAKMAEQAYHFERQDDSTTLLGNDYWKAPQAGLMAGERLLLDLHNLERRFLETNYRDLEVEQSFSLAQFDPSALLKLQHQGECNFSIPEVFFDLAYPGHYRRRIRALRLTIPCVVGPYTDVGATLRMTKSYLRTEPKTAASARAEVPLRHTTVIATSTAQNDSGVFEFSFRDERYMPFEGAGAISDWTLTLPKTFRPFDYGTISDVIVRVSYTAEEDGALRTDVEEQNAALEGRLLNYLANVGMPHVFSLRHDFPDAWSKLTRSPVNTSVDIELTERHVPFFYSGRNLVAGDLDVVLETATLPTVKLEVDDTTLSGLATQPAATRWALETEGLYKATVPNDAVLGKHTLKVASSGNVASAVAGSNAALDDSKLTDLFLRFTYRVKVGN